MPLKALRFQPEPTDNDDKNGPEIVALQQAAKNKVWVLRENKLIETAVELGVNNGINQQILSGLSKGDKVALQYVAPSQQQKGEKAQENPFMPKPPGGRRNNK